MYDLISNTSFEIPRGTPELQPISLDMTLIYEAENRLYDTKTATPLNAAELMGYFNQACNTATKYLAWIEFEILQAKKYLELAKAEIILEKAPQEFQRMKDKGIKYNEDFRDAVVAQDSVYQQRLDVLNSLTAAKVWLENKAWSFVRAYNACRFIAENRGLTAASPNLNNAIGDTLKNDQFTASTSMIQEQPNSFIGKTKL